MGIQAWMIKSWPVCQWYLHNAQSHWPAFEHANTQVRSDTDPEGRRIGETVWCANVDGQSAAAAWEWTEIAPGVVLLSNPNCVATNLHLVTPEHRTLEAINELVALNTFLHSLPWQQRVCDEIKRHPPVSTDSLEPRNIGLVEATSRRRLAQHQRYRA